MGQIADKMNALDKNLEIVVYCRTGNRSQTVVEFLYENGFKKVKNLKGGIHAWADRMDSRVEKY